MKTSFLIIRVGFFLSVLWIGYLGFNAGNEVMIDGITVTATIVTVLSVIFSIVSWSLFSWATHSINARGVMLSVITGIVLITPFNGDLGPMAAVLVGLVAGFAAHMIEKKITNTRDSKSLVIGIITLVVSIRILFLIITFVQPTVHVWDTGDGVGAWTGTPQGMEQQAISIIGAVISAGYALGIVMLLVLPVLYFILKRKNIPRKPYFILALAGSLTYLGIDNLVSFLLYLTTMPPQIDYTQPYILDQLILSLMVSIVELSVGGILLCRSSIIRKLIKK